MNTEVLPHPPMPDALRRRGLVGVSDNVGAGQRVHVAGSLIVSFFRDELLSRVATPAGGAGRLAKGVE